MAIGDIDDDVVFVLRTCNADMTDCGGFRWPEAGPVEALDWDPAPRCGGGLHGLPEGRGDQALLNSSADAKWIVFAAHRADGVDVRGKSKWPRAWVVYCGNVDGALDTLATRGTVGALPYKKATSGDYGQSTSGDKGQSTSGDGGQSMSGDYGQSTSGDKGQSTSGDYGQSTSGNDGQSTSGDYGQSTSGNKGQSTSGYGGKSTSGDGGQSTSGDGGQSTSGYDGRSTSGDGGQSTSGNDGQSTSGNYGQSTSGRYGRSTSGDGGQSTSGHKGKSTSGNYGTATAGHGGILVLLHCDRSDRKKNRPQVKVAYVGEDGIEPNVPYKLDDNGEFVKAELASNG